MANPADDDDDDAKRTWQQRLGDTRNWDKFIIIIAALLTGCFVAFMFTPSFGPSITKVFEDATKLQEAEAKKQAAPPQTPGEVQMMLFPSKPAPAKPTAPAKN